MMTRTHDPRDWGSDSRHLDRLVAEQGLAERLRVLHAEMADDPRLAGISRMAAAVYDPATDTVKSFIHSNTGGNAVVNFTGRLADIPGLAEVARSGQPLVVDDLSTLRPPRGVVAATLLQQGLRSRYVVPIHGPGGSGGPGRLFGFLFLNAVRPGYFTPEVMAALRPYERLVSMMVVHELSMLRAMLGALRAARQVSFYRDEETGGHLDRMSHYAGLIATTLGPLHGRSQDFAEYLRLYAPMHDIGKVAVPDHILLKPGRLTPEEFAVMQTHVGRGLEIIDALRADDALSGLPHMDMLRNVVGCHHETLDGAGYPLGLSGDAIPLEGRITTVADVFDALTSRRPYKAAWSNGDALAFLREKAGTKFASDCVEALAARMDAVRDLQERFRDPDPEPEPPPA